jgi:hypothetical protein
MLVGLLLSIIATKMLWGTAPQIANVCDLDDRQKPIRELRFGL